MVKLEDYRDEKTGDINWGALEAAEIRAGEKCKRCKTFIMWAKGFATLCSTCEAVESSAEPVDHPTFIRCPKCGHLEDVQENCSYAAEYDDLYEGEHTNTCGECETEYTFETRVSYTFVSPARVTEPEESDEEADEDD